MMYTIDDDFDFTDYQRSKDLIIKNKNMSEKFNFLTATRFWALVIGAVMFYLQAKGFIGNEEMVLANTILGGFIGIKTIDRISDKQLEGKKIESGQTNAEAKEI